MIKRILLSIIIIKGFSPWIFCVPSLYSLAIQQLFNFKNDQQKGVLNQKFIRGEVNFNCLKFEGIILRNLDLSGMYLRGIDFSGCTFIDVDLSYADLTEVNFDCVCFINVRLYKAILYYPLDKDSKPIMNQALEINHSDPYYILI